MNDLYFHTKVHVKIQVSYPRRDPHSSPLHGVLIQYGHASLWLEVNGGGGSR